MATTESSFSVNSSQRNIWSALWLCSMINEKHVKTHNTIRNYIKTKSEDVATAGKGYQQLEVVKGQKHR